MKMALVVAAVVAALGFPVANATAQGAADGGGLTQADAPTPNRTNAAATGPAEPVDPQRVGVVGSGRIAPDRAAEIAKTLLATAPPRATPFSAEVGAPIPGNVDLRPLPPSVVDLVPEYRGYHYVAGNGEVAIVRPATRQVVEVISAGGGRK